MTPCSSSGGCLRGTGRLLSYALPPLDVARSMLCESVCQQLSYRKEVLLSSVRFCKVSF